jgi:CysZ protein
MTTELIKGLTQGASCYGRGIRLLWHPGLRPYLWIPLLINVCIFAVLTHFLVQYFGLATDWVMQWVPSLFQFLAWLLWLIMLAVFLIAYGYTFNAVTNLLAAPFYGLLAERTEQLLTGQDLPPEPLHHQVPRVFAREIHKLIYFLGRGIFVLLVMLMLSFIPLINLAVPVIAALWGAWCMAIQYVDYPADNHRLPFVRLRQRLRSPLAPSLGFGGLVLAASTLPIINLFAMPAAVTGGTVLWLEQTANQTE